MTKTIKATVKNYELQGDKWEKVKEEIREIEESRFKSMTSRKEIQLHDAITGGKTTLRKGGMTDLSPCGTMKSVWSW